MPEIESVPLKLTVTAVLRHPAELADGVAVARAVGALASRLIVTDWLDVPPALVAVQVKDKEEPVPATNVTELEETPDVMEPPVIAQE